MITGSSLRGYLWPCMLALSVASTGPAQSAIAAPSAFFTDLDSSPVGAYVTVWGSGFGAARGTVKVGPASASRAEIISWSDSRIEFRVPRGSGRGLSVVRGGESSNTLPFITRGEGRIFFVSAASGSNGNNGLSESSQGKGVGPWKDLSPVLGTVRPGDVVYVRAGVYDNVGDERWRSNLFIRSRYSGNPGNPIALVAYPGETAIIGGSGSAATARAVFIEGGVTDWTVAKFRFQALHTALDFNPRGEAARIRVVGNTASDIPSGTGTIGMKSCSDCKILGNHVYSSGRPRSKLAHLIYYGGFGVGRNVEIAWNLLHDEQGGRCLQVYGHRDEDRLNGLFIHDNIIYNCPYDGILIGKSDAPSKDWISDALIYNNVVYNCGNSAIRVDNPGVNVRILQNTLYACRFGVTLQQAKGAEIRNNIFARNKDGDLRLDSVGALVMNHNGYSQNPPPVQDTHPLEGNPHFADPAKGDFSLAPASSFRRKGTALVRTDFDTATGIGYDPSPDLGALGWAKRQSAWQTPVRTTHPSANLIHTPSTYTLRE